MVLAPGLWGSPPGRAGLGCIRTRPELPHGVWCVSVQLQSVLPTSSTGCLARKSPCPGEFPYLGTWCPCAPATSGHICGPVLGVEWVLASLYLFLKESAQKFVSDLFQQLVFSFINVMLSDLFN